MTAQSAMVIGAGFGGLSAAIALAHAGLNVTIVERLPTAGGRAQTLQRDGFRFDMGPSWYWMPKEIDQWFAQFGITRSKYYTIHRLDPSYKIFFPSAHHSKISSDNAPPSIQISADLNTTQKLFEQLEPGAGGKFETYMKLCRLRYDIAMKHFIYRNWYSKSQFLNRSIFANLNILQPFRSWDREIKKFFRDSRIRKILEFPSVFLGAHPRKIPAIYSLMNHIDFGEGTWYPNGGFKSVIDAMCTIAASFGVKFLYSTEVTGFSIENGRIRAAKTASTAQNHESEIESDLFVVNADYPYTELHLLPPQWRSYGPRYWNQCKLSAAVLNFYIGVNCPIEPLAHHTFFFDADWETHFSAVYNHPRWIEKPLFYTHAPSLTDKTAAPPNCHTLFILIPIAPDLPDTDEIRDKMLAHVLHRIMQCTGINLRPHICFSTSHCIREFQQDYHAYKGSAFGLGHTLLQTAGFRPANKSKRLSNLYYCGHYTTPGTGVTMSMISGQIVAERIMHEI